MGFNLPLPTSEERSKLKTRIDKQTKNRPGEREEEIKLKKNKRGEREEPASHPRSGGTWQLPGAHRYSLTLLPSDSFSCRAAMARRRCSFSCSISRSERTLM